MTKKIDIPMPASTFAIRTSQHTNQKLQKSLLSLPDKKLFSPSLKKIKNTVKRKNKNIALNDGEPTTSSLARFFLPQAQHRKNLAKLPKR